MPIYRKPRKSRLDDFVSMIVPDRIEEAFERVDQYFTEHLKLSFDTPDGVAGVLNELIRDHGQKVRKALYALLCEENGPLRPLVTGATASGAKSAVGFLVPVLAAQFALAPAVALLVATLVIKAVSANGDKALCEALIGLQKKSARHVRGNEAQIKSHPKRAAEPKRRKPGIAGTQTRTGRPRRVRPEGEVKETTRPAEKKPPRTKKRTPPKRTPGEDR